MKADEHLEIIRRNLFYGLIEYTKSLPDLFIPHRFSMVGPSKGKKLLDTVVDAVKGEEELLLYFHLPFCFSECTFCNSFPHETDREVQDEYLNSMIREIDIFSKSGIFAGKKARCIYFGGGTPTAFSNRDIKRILDKVGSSMDLASNCNITIEAHPATVAERKRIKGLADSGITRMSVGCQTFDEKVLQRCHRSNTESEVYKVIMNTKESGLSSNIDMMIGLPGQTVEAVKRDLEILDRIQSDSIEYIRHEIVNPLAISLYKRNRDLLVHDDDLFQMVCLTQQWIDERGYEQNGHFRNDKHFPYRYYWLKEMPILAFGPRTRSYTKYVCYDKHEELSSYFRLCTKGIPPIGRYIALTKKEQMYRSLFLQIQIREGLALKDFENRYNEDALETFAPFLERGLEYGCIQTDKDSVRLTKYGRYFVEDVCCLILDCALNEFDANLKREPHSSTALSSRLDSLSGAT
ncbi:coproporphyrinogen-III oxidase family protein [Thermodesulfobacteriota bacterium]